MSTGSAIRNPRPIRSFVRREGRMTPAQQRALQHLWPRFGLEPQGLIDLDAWFGRRAPRTLEIGFGNGETLLALARAEPQSDFIGIEVHRPGVGRVLMELDKQGISNVRLLCMDAVEALEHHLPDAGLDRVLLFFPDPWPKKRHHKRRLVQPGFVELVARKLRPGGAFHLATDWQDYAEQMLAVLEASDSFENSAGRGQYAPRPGFRPVTRFERRGRRLGHGVRDLAFARKAGTGRTPP
jgi:tRNA (guanine-N7-)-methyltransferase